MMRGPTFYVALVALSFSFPCALAQSSTTAILNAFKASNLIPDGEATFERYLPFADSGPWT